MLRPSLLIAVLMFAHVCAAGADSIDPDRLTVAKLRVERKWTDAKYDQLVAYDRARLEQLRQETRSRNAVDEIARVLASSNPDETAAVLNYLNETLLPFVVSYKARYLCIETENYYNFNLSTKEIANVPELGESWLSDLGLWLVETEAARKQVGLALPDSLVKYLDLVKSRGGLRVERNSVRLDCDQEQSQRLQTTESLLHV